MYGAKQAKACDAKLFRGRKASQLQIICTRRGVYQTLQIFFVCIIIQRPDGIRHPGAFYMR